MRRAEKHFWAADIKEAWWRLVTEPVSVPMQRWLPDARALAQSGQAMKEWVGQQLWQHP